MTENTIEFSKYIYYSNSLAFVTSTLDSNAPHRLRNKSGYGVGQPVVSGFHLEAIAEKAIRDIFGLTNVSSIDARFRNKLSVESVVDYAMVKTENEVNVAITENSQAIAEFVFKYDNPSCENFGGQLIMSYNFSDKTNFQKYCAALDDCDGNPLFFSIAMVSAALIELNNTVKSKDPDSLYVYLKHQIKIHDPNIPEVMSFYDCGVQSRRGLNVVTISAGCEDKKSYTAQMTLAKVPKSIFDS